MAWRFWLLWALASSLLSGTAFTVAFIPAGIVGWLIALPLAATVVGVAVGLAVGTAQSYMLPWPAPVRQRWLCRSLVGWPIGMTLGLLVALAAETYRFPRGGPGGFLGPSSLLLETAAPIAGLVLGLILWPVVPAATRGSPVLWLFGHTIAVSAGWIVGRLVPGGSWTSLSVSSAIFGPLCYGVVSASIMLSVVRHGARGSTAPIAQSEDAGIG